MAPNDTILIKTIANYSETLINAVRDYSIDEAVLLNNLAFRGMAAFFVQQIGECAKKLSPAFTTKYPEIEWRAMSGLRNRIAHNYGRIDVEILWDVITHDVPELYDFCKSILEENNLTDDIDHVA